MGHSLVALAAARANLERMNITVSYPPEPATAPRSPLGHAPARRPGSMRRTTTLDSTWPGGRLAAWRMHGQGRDLLTPSAGPPLVVAQADIAMTITTERMIAEIDATPPDPRLDGLRGARGGGHLRSLIAEALPGEREAGTPLYLLLDDVSGASLVARWAWSQWDDTWLEGAKGHRSMENVCTGFRTGASSLIRESGAVGPQNTVEVPPLENPDDPLSWHPLAVYEEISMRRARRIDVWVEDEVIQIESAFQDSATLPKGGRAAIHEYAIHATADLATGRLLTLVADPRILPYRSCPAAIVNTSRLLGEPLSRLRTAVVEALPGPLGCTHLNDMMRALAEAPILAARLLQAA
jgi:hypothetical protein